MQEVSASTADQEGASEQDELFEDALESVAGLLDMDQDSKVKTRQIMVRPGQVEECLAAFHGKIKAQEDHIGKSEDALSRKMQQKMDQLEMNCNANIGEAVAAGIEEIQESTVATGKEMRDMVEAAVKHCDGEMRALQGAHDKSDRALKLQLHAVLEQARDMRVWREQHNAALTAMEKRSKNALARTERMCEATMDSVRTGAAASLATEVRRLEGMLTGHAVQFADVNPSGPSNQMHHIAILHDEVEEFKLPSPPSEISTVQNSPKALAPVTLATWQRPRHDTSVILKASYIHRGAPQAARSHGYGLATAMSSLDDVESLNVSSMGGLRPSHGYKAQKTYAAAGDTGAQTGANIFSSVQQGLHDILEAHRSSVKRDQRLHEATAVLSNISMEAEDARRVALSDAAGNAAAAEAANGDEPAATSLQPSHVNLISQHTFRRSNEGDAPVLDGADASGVAMKVKNFSGVQSGLMNILDAHRASSMDTHETQQASPRESSASLEAVAGMQTATAGAASSADAISSGREGSVDNVLKEAPWPEDVEAACSGNADPPSGATRSRSHEGMADSECIEETLSADFWQAAMDNTQVADDAHLPISDAVSDAALTAADVRGASSEELADSVCMGETGAAHVWVAAAAEEQLPFVVQPSASPDTDGALQPADSDVASSSEVLAEASSSLPYDEPADAEDAEETGAAQFWQAAMAEMEVTWPVLDRDSAEDETAAPDTPYAHKSVELAPPQHLSQAHKGIAPDTAVMAAPENDIVSEAIEAGSQQAVASHAAEGSAYSSSPRPEGPLALSPPPIEISPGVCTPAHQSPSEQDTLACGSSPAHAATTEDSASAHTYNAQRHHARGMHGKAPQAGKHQRWRAIRKHKAALLHKGHDAEILAALLALQMAVSEQATAISHLKEASRAQPCSSPLTSPVCLTGIMRSHLDVAWSEEDGQDASAGVAKHETTTALPSSTSVKLATAWCDNGSVRVPVGAAKHDTATALPASKPSALLAACAEDTEHNQGALIGAVRPEITVALPDDQLSALLAARNQERAHGIPQHLSLSAAEDASVSAGSTQPGRAGGPSQIQLSDATLVASGHLCSAAAAQEALCGSSHRVTAGLPFKVEPCAVSNPLHSAAAGAAKSRAAASSLLGAHQYPSQHGSEQEPVQFSKVLQGWRKERKLQASVSRK